MSTEQARFNMIEQQIRPWDVLDPAVLSLLAIVKREDFMPPGHRALAFMDTEVPLPQGQFMLSPKLEARLLQEVAVHKHERVLLLGANASYLAALLGHQARQVLVIDSHAEVIALTQGQLKQSGVSNVSLHQVRADDLPQGLPAEAPFDVIMLAGSVPDAPKLLLNQLKPVSGRLIAIVGQEPVMQATLYSRNAQGQVHGTVLFDTIAPRLAGFAEPSLFNSEHQTASGMLSLTVDQLTAFVAAHPQATLLDVREPWEVALARIDIPHAVLRSIPMQQVPEQLAQLDAEQAVVCICHHGMRSAQVAHYLERQGFDQVFNLQGGIDAWSLQVDPAVPRY